MTKLHQRASRASRIKAAARAGLLAATVGLCLANSSPAGAGDTEEQAEAARRQLLRYYDFIVGGAIVDTLCGIRDARTPEALWHYTRIEHYVASHDILSTGTVDEHFRETVPFVHRHLPDCASEAPEIARRWKALARDLMPTLQLPAYAGDASDQALSEELLAATLRLVALEQHCGHLDADKKQVMHRHATTAYDGVQRLYGDEFAATVTKRVADTIAERPEVDCADATVVERRTIAGMRKASQLNMLLFYKLEP